MTRVQDHLSIQYFRCSDCGHSIVTEAKVCPKCGSLAMEKRQSQGKGVVIESAITYFPPKSHESLAPYTSVLIKMGEGFKSFGVMEGEVKDLPEGTFLTAIRVDEKSGSVIFAKH
jgi:uncharacterized OB-fold protein